MRVSGTSARLREHVRTNVVGYVALCCFAFMGTAQALPGKSSVNSGDIKNNNVRGADVRDESLGPNDVGGLTGNDLAGALLLEGTSSTTGIYDNEMRVDGDDSSLAQIGKDFVFVRSPADNPVTIDGAGFINLADATTPANPSNDNVRIVARDSGGNTELIALFPNGDVDQIAIED